MLYVILISRFFYREAFCHVYSVAEREQTDKHRKRTNRQTPKGGCVLLLMNIFSVCFLSLIGNVELTIEVRISELVVAENIN
jgi:hypothetical protein